MMPRFTARLAILSAIVLGSTSRAADPPDLAFQPAEEAGFYRFDTGVLRGRVRLNGRSQGITELVHVPSGAFVAAGGGLPGLFSYYRVLSTDRRYGKAVRDWPTETGILPDGAMEVFWPAGEEHPLEITAVYRWSRPDSLDVVTVVKPLQDMPRFEIFVSSYYEKPFRARAYVTPPGDAAAGPRFVPLDRTPDAQARYVMVPRDEQALAMIRDGRWTYPPNPVEWDVIRWLAAPLVMRRDETSGLTALMMCPAEDCFAVSSPWNPASPDASGYRSLYLSLFGRDVKAGQTARARCRLVVAQNLSERAAVECYERYLKELREAKPASPSPWGRRTKPLPLAGTVKLTEAADGKTLSVPVGATVEVRLPGNPTTGYSWELAEIEGDAVEQVGKIEFRSRAHRRGMLGVGGTFRATFKATKAGTSTVTIQYARPWEKDKPPEKTFRVTVQAVQAE
jgi:inhibitor of cysteine peptidase